MSDVRTILERGVGGAAPPPDGFERMLRRRDRKRRNKRIAAGIVGLAITIALGLAGTSILRSEQSTPANPTLPFRHNGPIALAGNAPGDAHGIVTLIDPQTGSRSELTVCPDCSVEGFVDLAWSPDGMKIAFTSDGGGGWPDGVFDVATNQTTTIATCDPPDPDCIGLGNVDWSPDGSRIALGQGRRLDLVDADGSNRTMLADFSDERGYVYGPTWSPDGTRIAFSVAFEGSTPKSRLYVVDADGSNLQMLIERPGDSGVRAPDWSPDGSRIAYMAFVEPEDPPDLLGALPQVWIVDVDGSDPTKLFVGGWCCFHNSTGVSWAPDGTAIAFVGASPGPEGGETNLYLIDPDGGGAQVIARGISFGPPAWRPAP
jgi:Tol biopolymer transport system component